MRYFTDEYLSVQFLKQKPQSHFQLNDYTDVESYFLKADGYSYQGVAAGYLLTNWHPAAKQLFKVFYFFVILLAKRPQI